MNLIAALHTRATVANVRSGCGDLHLLQRGRIAPQTRVHFEVRVASLKHLLAFKEARPRPDGVPLTTLITRVHERAAELLAAQYETWNDALQPALAAEGITFSDDMHWTAAQQRWARDDFQREILPVLAPLGLDSAHPFPRILNKSLNVAVVLRGKDAFGREGSIALVIELLARFDEEANIKLANRLQQAGVQVVYGVVGFKTHAKMLLIVRPEAGALRRYAHLSTGNYHQVTSKLYTDLGLMTAAPGIGDDVNKVFQQLCSLGPVIKLKYLLESPLSLHRALLALIDREIAHAHDGKPARIVARVNALNEQSMVEALYHASCAGVEIDLIVRGSCILRPGLPGISERIRVRSVLGRFLEHSRVHWFANGGDAELYCWMERNLLRRVETCFPIRDAHVAARVFREALLNYLDDNVQAWLLDADGRYLRATPGGATPHSAQHWLLEQYKA